MGLMARNKGKRAEREIVAALQPVVNRVFFEYNTEAADRGVSRLETPILQRNTLQSDRGGYDIVGLDWIAPEVKRCEVLNLKAWWRQAKAQAKSGQTPVLFYRQNGSKWRVRMMGILQAGSRRVHTQVEVSLEAFLSYFEERLKQEISVSS